MRSVKLAVSQRDYRTFNANGGFLCDRLEVWKYVADVINAWASVIDVQDRVEVFLRGGFSRAGGLTLREYP